MSKKEKEESHEIPAPRGNPSLYGREQAEAEFLTAKNRAESSHSSHDAAALPHAWIIAGPRGTGKATLAHRIARAMLAGLEDTLELPVSHPVFRRASAGSHTDLLTLEPAFDEKKDEEKQDISVEAARGVGAFLSLTPAEGKWRVVVVDSADALNANSANALLKTLEEPPPRALLLLVSHNPSRLLPTIRSRCRMLRLAPLEEPDFLRVMREFRPDIGGEDLRLLAELSEHSPGVALELARRGGPEFYRALLGVFAHFPKPPMREVQAMTQHLPPGSHAHWQAASRLTLHALALAARPGEPGVGEAEKTALAAMRAARPPSGWAEAYMEASRQFSLAARAHLDYKTVLAALLHGLEPTTR